MPFDFGVIRKLLIIPKNVSEGSGKGVICVVRHFLFNFDISNLFNLYMDLTRTWTKDLTYMLDGIDMTLTVKVRIFSFSLS